MEQTTQPTYDELKALVRQLRKENSELRIALARKDRFRTDAIALMSENFKLRRMIEIIGDERDDFHKRCEKAERGLYNLKKWIEINKDVYGGNQPE